MLNINYNPDVLSCLSNLSNDEVFTPPKLVNEMLDMLPQELFQNKETTFLDPVTKSGVFLREIAKRLNIGLKDQISDQQERINHIFTKQVYGVAITELTSLLARRSTYCSKYANGRHSVCTDFENEQGNIKYERIQHTWKNGKCVYCGASESEYSRTDDLETYAYQFIHTDEPQKLFNMKFDVIIGNPPYQLSDGGAAASAVPLYHKFVMQAQKLKPRFLTMIIPSRWFTSGKGLDKFREKMLNDKSVRVLVDYHKASDCFPNVEIKGGVCYFLWKHKQQGECAITSIDSEGIISKSKRYLLQPGSDVFIRYNGAISILDKVNKFNENPFKQIISARKPFGLNTSFRGLKEKKDKENRILLYANKSKGYVKENKIIKNNNWINDYKLFVPYAIGSGDSKSDIVKPILAEPGSACTETYLVFGPFASKKRAENAMTYINTKFFHFLLTLKKNTQHATSTAYEFVPLQNFNESWNDQKLFEKYELNKDEIEFIENNINNSIPQ